MKQFERMKYARDILNYIGNGKRFMDIQNHLNSLDKVSPRQLSTDLKKLIADNVLILVPVIARKDYNEYRLTEYGEEVREWKNNCPVDKSA